MDNSSRNIIKFIATITVAALVIMAARYYAESQKVASPTEVEDTSATPAPATAEAPVEESTEDPSDPQNPDGEIIEEDVQLIMGEPSMNIEQGGSSYYAPQPQPAPQAQDTQQVEPPIEQ